MAVDPRVFESSAFKSYDEASGILPSYVWELAVTKVNAFCRSRFTRSSLRWLGPAIVILRDEAIPRADTYEAKGGRPLIVISAGLVYKVAAVAHSACWTSPYITPEAVLNAVVDGRLPPEGRGRLLSSDLASLSPERFSLDELTQHVLVYRPQIEDPLHIERVVQCGLMFVLLHEIGHFYYQHIAADAKVAESLDAKLVEDVRRGLEVQADVFALHQLACLLCGQESSVWKPDCLPEEMSRVDWTRPGRNLDGDLPPSRALDMAMGIWCLFSVLDGKATETHGSSSARWHMLTQTNPGLPSWEAVAGAAQALCSIKMDLAHHQRLGTTEASVATKQEAHSLMCCRIDAAAALHYELQKEKSDDAWMSPHPLTSGVYRLFQVDDGGSDTEGTAEGSSSS